MMTGSSLETTNPPAQDPAPDAPRPVIQDWGNMRLEDAGDGHAVIVRMVAGTPTEFGDIAYTHGKTTHIIVWNQAGLRAFGMALRDDWDDFFYATMDRWCRS